MSSIRCNGLQKLTALTILAWASAACAQTQPPEAIGQSQALPESVARAVESTVCIFSADGQGGGSGVIVSDSGFAVTNFHVVQPCGLHMRCGLSDGQLYDAVLVGIDPTGDVAVIKLLGRNDFVAATLGDSDQVRAGQACFALGNPFLLATDFQPTLTVGIVSAVHRYQYPEQTLLEYADCIQTDAAINPGNSGGPLFDSEGVLIGINGRCSFEKRGRVNVGVGYAISINQVKMFIDGLTGGRIMDHASLGATVTSASDGRVVIDNILESSDAFRRGLRYGDQIVAFGGRDVQTANQFKNVLGIFPAGWITSLEYVRDGQRKKIEVRLAGLHADTLELSRLIEGESVPDPNPLKPPDKKPEVGKRTIPVAIEKVYAQREGFANDHFNRLQTERILRQQSPHKFANLNHQKWTIEATTESGELAHFVLTGHQSGLAWGDDKEIVDLAADDLFLDNQALEQKRGILLAIHLWRRFTLLTEQEWGELQYLGSIPWPHSSDRWSPIIRERTHGLEIEYAFESQELQLSGLRVYFDNASDPWNVSFKGGEPGQPESLKLWHGDNAPIVLSILRFERE